MQPIIFLLKSLQIVIRVLSGKPPLLPINRLSVHTHGQYDVTKARLHHMHGNVILMRTMRTGSLRHANTLANFLLSVSEPTQNYDQKYIDADVTTQQYASHDTIMSPSNSKTNFCRLICSTVENMILVSARFHKSLVNCTSLAAQLL